MTTRADSTADLRLELMGTTIRILVGPAARPDLDAPRLAAERVERFLRGYDRALSRFRPDSELTALNADVREVVPASDLLRDAVRAALEAAEISGGLVDPAMLDELERAGYRTSWSRAERLAIGDALRQVAVPRAAARPRERALWRRIIVDERAGTIARPPGVRLDTGGSGKGHAADLAARLLDGYAHWAVDCGGDVRIGGENGAPRRVEVEHGLTGEMLPGFEVRRGAVATSGLRSRIWRGDDGRVQHHLLDPSTGSPAFTGIVAATALAPTAVHAEALAKAALLSGPEGARRVLGRYGGVIVDESGRAERFEPAPSRPVVRLRMPRRAAA